jgi:LysR family transcriptional regulator, low CO2-responsive transcriptional regulator
MANHYRDRTLADPLTAGVPLSFEQSVTLHQLRVFKAVADRLSFSAAAHDLKLSQPSVSYQVKELEQAVGTDLFDRFGKHVSLTQAGHLLYGFVRQTLNVIDEAAVALGELQGLERGSLKVGASTTVGIYVMPTALGAFKKLHPHLDVSLEIGGRGAIQEKVLRNELDLAVVGPPLKDPDLVVEPFINDELVVIAPREHPLAGRRRLTLKDLKGEPFLMREEGSDTRAVVEKVARRANVRLRVEMALGSNGAIKHAVESGLGLAILSRHAVGLEETAGKLALLDVEGFPVRRQWNIVHLKRNRLAAPVAGFIEFLRSGDWGAAGASGLAPPKELKGSR